MPSPIRLLPVLLLGLLAAVPGLRAREAPGWLDGDRFALALKYTGLTYHPDGGENEERYKRSLDSRDFWVLQVGGQLDGDYKLHKWFYLRSSTSLYRDCADVWAGFFHFGFRANYDFPAGVSLRVGIGPTFIWRENWLGKVKGYTRDSFFGPARDETFQTAFLWHGGDVEAEWRAWDRVSLVYSVIPGYPEVLHNSLGARWSF
jgi:hypothetical protein